MSPTAPPDTPVALLTPLVAADLAEYCLRAVGPCRVHLVGAELFPLAAFLRAAGCEVDHAGTLAGSTVAGDVVVAWVASADARAALVDLGHEVNTLVLVGSAGPDARFNIAVGLAAGKGWQQHPAVFTLPGAPQDVRVHMLSRAGVSTADADSLPRASYYGLAAALVRPGDAVLATDAARDDRWRVLVQQSRCRWLGVIGDRASAGAIQPGVEWLDKARWHTTCPPVDVVIARLSKDASDWAETLQHAHDVLVRSGRFVVEVPLPSGRNPELRGLLATLEQRGMVIDRAWWQSFDRPAGPEQFVEVAPDPAGHLAIDPDSVASADALVLMAVKIDGAGITQDPTLDAPNAIAFQRDYLDASLVRLIVSVGLRLESSASRRMIARQVMRDAPVDSADYGAALCVLLYDPAALAGGARGELLAAAQRYIDGPARNPTMLRWQVSLAFASATLIQSSGDLPGAAVLYERVLAFDVLDFSPLLGTKTTAAAVRLGWIHFGRGDVAAARQAWARGLDEARRLASQPDWTAVVGDPGRPETFGMPEFALVMDEAGCLASALRLTSETPLRPGLAWQWANRSWRQQLQEARTDQQRRQAWEDNLQNAKDWLDGQYHQLNAELASREQAIQQLDTELSSRERVIQHLDSTAQALAVDAHGMRAAFRLAHLQAVAERSALAQQLDGARAEYEQLTHDHQRLGDANRQLIGAHRQLLASYEHLIDAAQHLSAATGAIMDRQGQGSVPIDSIAHEMSRLATALNRLPLKGLVRNVLRALSFVLGRK